MVLSDILILIQTFALIITALIILWYAIETRKIRKIHEFESEKSLNELNPLFRVGGGNHNGKILKYHFTNKGGSIKDISISTQKGFKALIDPTNNLQKDETINIQLENEKDILPDDVCFEIHFANKINQKKSKKFCFSFKENNMLEID